MGNLELFYDLVFVVLVGQLAHHLAAHVTLRGVVDFGVLFAVMWLTWLNGSIYHELHGREDGRARALMFLQMLLLALLATEAGEASGEDGRLFAWVLTAVLVVQTFQWWTVYRLDEPHFQVLARRYLLGSVLVMLIAAGAALTPSADARLATWALFLVVALGGASALLARSPRETSGLQITGSLVERYGLFVIIVLGEIVVGVVDGLSASSRDLGTVATALAALTLSFGFWWTYFDLVGGRLPRPTPRAAVGFLTLQLPVTGAIAAAGAGMVSLIEHAGEPRTPAPTAWLISGAVAAMLLATGLLSRCVDLRVEVDGERLEVAAPLVGGAVAAVLIGSVAPAPWALAALLTAVLVVLWWVVFLRWIRSGGAEHLLAGEDGEPARAPRAV